MMDRHEVGSAWKSALDLHAREGGEHGREDMAATQHGLAEGHEVCDGVIAISNQLHELFSALSSSSRPISLPHEGCWLSVPRRVSREIQARPGVGNKRRLQHDSISRLVPICVEPGGPAGIPRAYRSKAPGSAPGIPVNYAGLADLFRYEVHLERAC